MAQPNPTQTVTNPRIGKLIELEVSGRIKPEHQTELDTYRAQGLAPKRSIPGSDATEGERKASAFLSRALGSNRSYEETGVGARSYIGQKLKDNAPDFLNQLPGFMGNSPERQVSDTAQDEFIAASLRQDSGAAIPPEEMERQRRIYFPMPGEGPEAVAAKRQARLRAIDGLMQSAGRSITQEQRAVLDKMREDLAGAISGEGAGDKQTEVVPLLEGAQRKIEGAIDEAAGVQAPANVRVEVGDPSQKQSPEFRAGLEKLLNEGATKEQIEEYWSKNAVGGLNAVAPSPAVKMDPIPQRGGNGFMDTIDAGVRGIADTATLGFADELAAAGNTIFGDGTMAENLAKQRSVDAYDAENSPWARGLGQLAGAVVPVGVGRIGMGAKSARDYAAAGGVLGAGYGFGSGETLEDRFAGGVKAGIGGAAAGLSLGKIVEMYGARPPRGPKPPTPGQEVKAAADRLGIGDKLLPADVGGTGTRMATAMTQATLGGIPIAEAAERAVTATAGARNAIADAVGSGLDNVRAGQAAQSGARDFIRKSEERGNSLFEAISIPNKVQAIADNTRSALAEVVKGFESNPELSRIWTGNDRLRRTLEAMTPQDIAAVGRQELAAAKGEFAAASDDLARAASELEKARGLAAGGGGAERVTAAQSAVAAAEARVAGTQQKIAAATEKANMPPQGGEVSWEDMKRLRSIVGEIVGKPGLSSDGAADAAMRKFYGALTKDMEATAAQQGPKALQEFRRANQYWRGRQDRIDNVLGMVLGDDLQKGAQPAFEAIERATNKKGGDPVKLGRLMRSLPKEDADTVRATIIQRMGQARSGGQDATQEVFSPAQFMTQWSNMSPRAKSILFNDRGTRQALDDLVTVTSAMKASEKYQNVSKTALGVNAFALLTTSVGNIVIGSLAGAGSFAAGKILSSPIMVRWLTRTIEKPEMLRQQLSKLSGIAARNPQIAEDIGQFGDAITRAANDNAYKAAASGSDQEQ